MSKTVFSEKASEYKKGRLGYAPEAIERIFSSLVQPGESVADIGSGTGILSQEFLARGIDVYCVEPDDNMRNVAEKNFNDNKYFHSIAARAENTGLPNDSISLITAASSFHWFDHMAFRNECLRILRREGVVCIMINARLYDNELTKNQHKLCTDFCPRYKSLCHGFDETDMRISDFFGHKPEHEEYTYSLNYTEEEFLARSLSSSYSLIPGDNRYLLYVEKLQKLITDNLLNGKICVQNKTHLFYGKMS